MLLKMLFVVIIGLSLLIDSGLTERVQGLDKFSGDEDDSKN